MSGCFSRFFDQLVFIVRWNEELYDIKNAVVLGRILSQHLTKNCPYIPLGSKIFFWTTKNSSPSQTIICEAVVIGEKRPSRDNEDPCNLNRSTNEKKDKYKHYIDIQIVKKLNVKPEDEFVKKNSWIWSIGEISNLCKVESFTIRMI